jgi:putative transposase
MKRKRFSEEQIIAILREHEAGVAAADLRRKHGMSSVSLYAWKAKFGGMDVSDAQKLRALEAENAKLKRLLADSMIDSAGLKDLLAKNGDARAEARSRHASDSGASDERASGVLGGRRRTCPGALPLTSTGRCGASAIGACTCGCAAKAGR